MQIFQRNLFLFFFIPHFLFSQQNNSLRPVVKQSIVTFFNLNQFEYPDSVFYIENTLYNFTKYLGKNNLGNNGLPLNDFIYPLPNTDYIGFNYSKNSYKNYFFSPQNLKFYNTRTPFTDLFYVIGSKREQLFKMVFSYNVKKNWNVTAHFNRIRSEGFYLRQNTNDNFIALSTNYKSLNNRYYLLASIIYNGSKNAENGGIANDTAFLNSENIDKKLIAIGLSNAKRTNINRTLYLKQYFNLGEKLHDSATNNSIIPKSRILLTTLYDDNVLKYEDDRPWSGYYSNIYYDSTRTFDSTYYNKIENELAWKRTDNRKHRGYIDIIGFGLAIKHQLIKIEQRELFKISDASTVLGLINTTQSKIDTTFGNIIAGGEIFNTYSNNGFWWNISTKYGLKGYNKEDYYVGAILKKTLRDSIGLIALKVENKSQTPDFIYNRYISNHFIWENYFNKMKEFRITFHFVMEKYNLAFNANYSNYSNVLYFNDSAIAKQYTGPVPVLSLFLKKEFTFYNWHLNNKINYQNVSDSSVIRLPKFILDHSLYYENDLFKHAMRLQIGASVFYTSSYYANTYMPATAQFYLQNRRKYGNYPFIDFFISARIKTVRIFFKIDHLNSGFMGNNYMLIPNYPINDRAFKFGISWMFYD